jgi:hypothetical protein
MKTKQPKVDQRLIYNAIELRKSGKTQEEIAVSLGVVQGTISIILRANGLGGPLTKPSRIKRSYECLR